MSGNREASERVHSGKHRLDARARRSRDALGDALIALMQEKPFDDITVQEVLDQAGVSRSTFYHHFRDKEDLFARDAGNSSTVSRMLWSGKATSPTGSSRSASSSSMSI